MMVNEKDFEKFASEFRKEEKEILILTSDSGGSAARKGQGEVFFIKMKRQVLIMGLLVLVTTSLVLFLLFKSEETSPVPKYIVDESLKEEVNNNIGNMNGVPFGSLEMKLYEDDILVFDNFGEDERGELLAMLSIERDTAYIIGFVGFTIAFGFYLDLYEDSYELTYLVKSDSEIYKYNEQDTKMSYKLSVPCSFTSCTLTSKPTFMKGDSISGIVELKSDDFWQIANGRENKYRVELKAYFMAVE